MARVLGGSAVTMVSLMGEERLPAWWEMGPGPTLSPRRRGFISVWMAESCGEHPNQAEVLQLGTVPSSLSHSLPHTLTALTEGGEIVAFDPPSHQCLLSSTCPSLVQS